MSDEIKQVLTQELEKLGGQMKTAMGEYHAELEKHGKASTELTGKVDGLAQKYDELKTQLIDLAQQQTTLGGAAEVKAKTAGEEFIKSDAYKLLSTGEKERVRFEVKNTVVADSTTTFPMQMPGVIPGDFAPLTIRQRIPTINVSSNAVNSLRENVWTNNAAGVIQTSEKPESSLTFEQYNVAIEVVAHWIKVSNQLLADAPAVAAYIDTRLRDGLAQKVESQLLLGTGTPPQLSGLTDSGNFVAFTPDSGANLIESINKAKYALWATGNAPDTVIVNPSDWAAIEVLREGAGSGAYLYGAPGTVAGMSPFGVPVVLSNHMPAGEFLIGNLRSSATVYQRQGAVVEMGFVNDDFTKNLVTLRAEERLGLAVDRPSGIMYGDITAS